MFPDFSDAGDGPAKRDGRPMSDHSYEEPKHEPEIKCLDDMEENATERSEKEKIFFKGADPVNQVAPLTGNSLITLRYQPELFKFKYKVQGREREENLMKMGKIKFIHKDEKLSINRNHYWPIFFASCADELRDADDGKVRKQLKKYKIFDNLPDLIDITGRSDKKSASDHKLSRKST